GAGARAGDGVGRGDGTRGAPARQPAHAGRPRGPAADGGWREHAPPDLHGGGAGGAGGAGGDGDGARGVRRVLGCQGVGVSGTAPLLCTPALPTPSLSPLCTAARTAPWWAATRAAPTGAFIIPPWPSTPDTRTP